MSKTISVVIPCYNCENYIEETLDSVFRQTVLPTEIVLVDDGSTDGSIALIESIIQKHTEISIKLLRQENSGPGAARNAGIHAAKGDWIAFLDSDDKWREKKIEAVLETVDNNENAVLIANDICEVYDNGETKDVFLHTYYNPRQPAFVQLYHGCFLSTSSVCVKKDVLEKVGGFDTTLRSAQDYDLWLRVSKVGEISFIPEIFEEYCIHKGSVSGNILLRYQCLLQIGKKYARDLLYYMKKRHAKKYVFRLIAAAHLGCMQGLFRQKKYIVCMKMFSKFVVESIHVIAGGYL